MPDLVLKRGVAGNDGYPTAFYLATKQLRLAPGLSMLTDKAIDAIATIAVSALFEEVPTQPVLKPVKTLPSASERSVVTVKEFKIPRRGTITVGTELTVEGIRGRVRFAQACFNRDSGKEWLDVIHVRTGKARVIDPAKIKTVHR